MAPNHALLEKSRKSVLPATTHINELLDEALEETFPASDPIAINIDIKSAGTEQRQHKGFILRSGKAP
jgi:hypothetical protein